MEMLHKWPEFLMERNEILLLLFTGKMMCSASQFTKSVTPALNRRWGQYIRRTGGRRSRAGCGGSDPRDVFRGLKTVSKRTYQCDASRQSSIFIPNPLLKHERKQRIKIKLSACHPEVFSDTWKQDYISVKQNVLYYAVTFTWATYFCTVCMNIETTVSQV
jgi:hypothetical protein